MAGTSITHMQQRILKFGATFYVIRQDTPLTLTGLGYWCYTTTFLRTPIKLMGAPP